MPPAGRALPATRQGRDAPAPPELGVIVEVALTASLIACGAWGVAPLLFPPLRLSLSKPHGVWCPVLSLRFGVGGFDKLSLSGMESGLG